MILPGKFHSLVNPDAEGNGEMIVLIFQLYTSCEWNTYNMHLCSPSALHTIDF